MAGFNTTAGNGRTFWRYCKPLGQLLGIAARGFFVDLSNFCCQLPPEVEFHANHLQMLVTSDPVTQDGAGDLGHAFPRKNIVNIEIQPTIVPAGVGMTVERHAFSWSMVPHGAWTIPPPLTVHRAQANCQRLQVYTHIIIMAYAHCTGIPMRV